MPEMTTSRCDLLHGYLHFLEERGEIDLDVLREIGAGVLIYDFAAGQGLDRKRMLEETHGTEEADLLMSFSEMLDREGVMKAPYDALEAESHEDLVTAFLCVQAPA